MCLSMISAVLFLLATTSTHSPTSPCSYQEFQDCVERFIRKPCVGARFSIFDYVSFAGFGIGAAVGFFLVCAWSLVLKRKGTATRKANYGLYNPRFEVTQFPHLETLKKILCSLLCCMCSIPVLHSQIP